MSDYKFKAKRKKADDNLQRWVEGSFIEYTNIYNEKVYGIVTTSGYRNAIEYNTVCQFIGMTDKEGTCAYFNDVVEFTPKIPNRFGSEYIDADYKLIGKIDKDEYNHSVLKILYKQGRFNVGDTYHIEGLLSGKIIGNIFD